MLASLIAALIFVESGGNPNAIGDRGRAIGVLQVHREVVTDVNRLYGTQYSHQQMTNPVKARQVAALYLQYWGRAYERQTGKRPSPEVLARIWNGGPAGWRKNSTLPYWKKVRQTLLYGGRNDSVPLRRWRQLHRQ